MLAFAIRRVGEPHGRWRRVARGTTHRERKFTAVRFLFCRCPAPAPEPACHPRATSSRSSRGDAGLPPTVRATRSCRLLSTPTSSAPAPRLARVNFRLPVQRQVIAVFRDQHMRQQPPARQRRARSDGSAPPLTRCVHNKRCQFRSNLPNHLEPRRHVLQYLQDVFAEMLQLAAAVRASGLLRRILSHFARQMFRQGPSRGFRHIQGDRRRLRRPRIFCGHRFSSSSRSSSCSIWRSSFSDLRPNCSRRSLAISSFKCSILLSRETSCSSLLRSCSCCEKMRAFNSLGFSASKSGRARFAAAIAANLADFLTAKLKSTGKQTILFILPSAEHNYALAAASGSLPAASTTAPASAKPCRSLLAAK
jgi:hypothetical protein